MSIMHAIPINSLIIVSLVLQLIGLTFAVLIDPHMKKKNKQIMIAMIILIFTLVAQNYVGYRLDVLGTMPYVRTIVGIYGYSVRPAILVLFLHIVMPEDRHRLGWTLIGINMLVYLTALFSGICFYIDEFNNFHRGPLGFTCHFISALLLVQLLILTMHEFNRAKKLETWIPIFNIAIITAAVIIDTFLDYRNYPESFLTISVVSCALFYYIWLHFQFIRQHENALMAEQRIQIMISQIQPHFMYNTLSTIQALCKTDPEKAFETTGMFGTYLRQNLESLNSAKLIPFEKELEHTKVYADIEKIRFSNIDVTYNIEDSDFLVPALSLQPIVENAIRHGVRIRKQGIVAVTTRRVGDEHLIEIKDNGKGFDTTQIVSADDSHIGLRNVMERVEGLCHGQVVVDSVIGEGTTITIHIPVSNDTKIQK